MSGRLLNLGDFPGLLLDRRFLGSSLAQATDKVFGMVLTMQATNAISQASLEDTLRVLDIYEEADVTGGRMPGLYGGSCMNVLMYPCIALRANSGWALGCTSI